MSEAATREVLAAPFPWFGGKSRAAEAIWARLGDVANYVEPFADSLAVLLRRPEDHAGRIETINDKDRFVANFWRAISAEPEEVALHADWPVNEADLESRHYWLVSEGLRVLLVDPDAYDARIAGWWVWGVCSWIGSGWCAGDGPWVVGDETWHKLPHLGNAGRGINRQLPHLGNAGQGINRQLPHLGNAGQGIYAWFRLIAYRLRGVRVCCGDWSRVVTPSVTDRHGLTGIVLDPPYADGTPVYGVEATGISAAVRKWAIANGANPLLRIALCGYEGEHEMPDDWTVHAWKAHGGYGGGRDGEAEINSRRERIWFSPHCLPLVNPLQQEILDFGSSA